MRRRFFSVAAALGVAVFAVGAVQAQDSSLCATFDWMNMEIDVHVSLNLKEMGLSLPTGRRQAENELFDEYSTKVEALLERFPVDSSSTLRDCIERGDAAPAVVDDILAEAKSVAPALSDDAENIACDYRSSLFSMASRLAPAAVAAPFPRLIDPPTVPSYTGVIIIANEELPVHGRHESARLTPCLFPKLWDSHMNLVFDQSFTAPSFFTHSALVHYADNDAIFEQTPSGLSPEIEKIVGAHPLKIIAQGVFGKHPTDPIIAVSDARVLLASEANRALLREGRAVIIIAPDLLRADYTK
jgi:hypothetical protein